MTEQQITEMVNEVLEEYFEIEPERLLPEMNIFEDLELDSLDIVDLVVVLQKKFGVRIRDDERIRTLRTLGDVYRFILTLQEEGASPAA
jgi:acyl carrier protein